MRNSVEKGINYQDEASYYKTLLESLPQKIFHKDINSVYISCNSNYASDFGLKPEEMIGKNDYELYPKELAKKYVDDDTRIMKSGKVTELEESYIKDGKEFFVNTIKVPVKDDKGKVTGIMGIFWDITEKKKNEEDLKQHKEHLEELIKERTDKLNNTLETVQRQAQEIMDISVPIIQIWKGIIVAPLIGTLDSSRTQQFMEKLLNGIVKTNSPNALIDITGVPTIDTQTAQHLLEAITAAKLLGAKVTLTGVSPAIAQTLVHLGIELSEIVTYPTLERGLRASLENMNLKVIKS